jgi:hypothetical protein
MPIKCIDQIPVPSAEGPIRRGCYFVVEETQQRRGWPRVWRKGYQRRARLDDRRSAN